LHSSMSLYVIGSLERAKGIKPQHISFLKRTIPIMESVVNALDDTIDESLEKEDRFMVIVTIAFGFLSLFSKVYDFQKRQPSDFVKVVVGKKLMVEKLLNKIVSDLLVLTQIPGEEKRAEIKIMRAKTEKEEIKHAVSANGLRSRGIDVYSDFIGVLLGPNENYFKSIRNVRFLELVRCDIEDISHDIRLNNPSPVSALYRKYYKKSPATFKNRVMAIANLGIENTLSSLEAMKDSGMGDASCYLKDKAEREFKAIKTSLNKFK